MTFEKAVQALIAAGLLEPTQAQTAITTLQQPNVEFTYPDWAKALTKAGLIASTDTDTAADVMEKAGWAEAKDDPDAFREGLEGAGIY
ncbi:MAG: hypothetical protein KDI02_22970 [Anaerolineae bacterium]|nr:hypothetical protein [Anaerolineae bacterium]